jgi:C4-type Zn-finger protein
MFDPKHFEIAKEYKIPLTGYYNVLVYECRNCDNNMLDELYDNIIGFADSNIGIVKIIECPKCFEKFYSHTDAYDYYYFLKEIERGKQKHFDKIYE